jgi:hypothetical protein
MKKLIVLTIVLGGLLACKSQKNGHCDAYGSKPTTVKQTKG